MPDISMCKNEKCLLRKHCYRFTAKPNTYQCYAKFNENKCKYFIKNENERLHDHK
jgi:hypothetical protein